MTPITFPYRTEAEWLALRKVDVTSTESAALFGLSPYLTAFELYHQKRSGELVVFEETTRMKWGKRLEATIAEGVAEDMGWVVQPLKVYMRSDRLACMGASFDFEIVELKWPSLTDERGYFTTSGPGIMEIKNVDSLVFKNDWTETAAGWEAPAHIEIQVQHQLEVADREWAAIVALVGGNDPHVIIRQRDRAVGEALVQMIGQFWRDVADGIEPAPDFQRDARFIAKLYGYAEPGKVIDWRNGQRADVAALLQQYRQLGELAKQTESERDAIKAQILLLIGDAEKVMTDAGTISAGVVGPTWVEAYERKGYRSFRFTPKKAPKEATT